MVTVVVDGLGRQTSETVSEAAAADAAWLGVVPERWRTWRPAPPFGCIGADDADSAVYWIASERELGPFEWLQSWDAMREEVRIGEREDPDGTMEWWWHFEHELNLSDILQLAATSIRWRGLLFCPLPEGESSYVYGGYQVRVVPPQVTGCLQVALFGPGALAYASGEEALAALREPDFWSAPWDPTVDDEEAGIDAADPS